MLRLKLIWLLTKILQNTVMLKKYDVFYTSGSHVVWATIQQSTNKKDSIYIYIYICVCVCVCVLVLYNDWYLYSRIVSNKAFIRWWFWVQEWFRGWSIITTNPERPSTHSRYRQDFVGLTSLNGITISTLMQLEPYLGSFFYVFPLVQVQD